MKIDPTAVKDIVESAKTHNYQVACRKHWEATHHKGDSDGVGNHPNAWFEASVTHYKALEEAETSASSTEGGATTVTATGAPVDSTIAAE